MPRIDQRLLVRLEKTLGVRRSRLYALIESKVAETHLPRHLAAIALASDHNVPVSKYASAEELAEIRGSTSKDHVPFAGGQQTPRQIIRSVKPITLDLSYISSQELQRILKRDVAELNAARSHGVDRTPKTCIVLSGSIAETLLLDVLLQRKTDALAAASSLPKKPSSNPEDWDLFEMVAIATTMTPPLLPDDTIAGATQLRKWRNLIHPGRELKDARNKRIRLSTARALNAISFLQLIDDELAP